MSEVIITIGTLPEWLIEKYFNEKDYYSLEELIAIIEDLDADVERLEEELKDFRQDMADNYKFVGQDYYESEY